MRELPRSMSELESGLWLGGTGLLAAPVSFMSRSDTHENVDRNFTVRREARSRREQRGWTGARDTNQGGPKARMFVSRVGGKPRVANRRSVTTAKDKEIHFVCIKEETTHGSSERNDPHPPEGL